MFNSLDSIILYVKNIEKAKQFYQEKLGFSMIRDDGNYVIFRVSSRDKTHLAINLATQKNAPGKQAIVLASRNIDRTYKNLKAIKVNIIEELQTKSWGKTFTFADIDGNKIEVVEVSN